MTYLTQFLMIHESFNHVKSDTLPMFPNPIFPLSNFTTLPNGYVRKVNKSSVKSGSEVAICMIFSFLLR
jgi:hypothetical protein